MKRLTEEELNILKKAENILFNYVDIENDGVFDDAFCELYKAIRNYKQLEKRNK